MRSPTASTFLTTRPRAKGGRGVRYARSHDCQRASRKPSVHAAALCSPCAHHVSNCTARRPRRTLRSHDCHQKFLKRGLGQKEAAAYSAIARFSTCITKPSAYVVTLCSPCAHHVPHCTAQAVRAEPAAYARLARFSTRIGRIFGAATTPGR
jgi:hypothetical protein